MSRLFYHTMQDNLGNLLFDVVGTMRLAGTGTLATIYGDEALTVILPNPMTNHPSFGSFKCFLPVGDFDFYMAKGGYTFETLTGVQGYGSMAQQEANAVAITGGTAGGLTAVAIGAPTGTEMLTVAGTMGVGLGAHFYHTVGINRAPVSDVRLAVTYPKNQDYGMVFTPSNTDTGREAILFQNVAGTVVGGILTSAVGTAYNTSSDARLKTAVDDLTGELGVIQALRPVSFRWLADDTPGVGFLAQDVAEVISGIVTGEADAMEEDGRIKPMQIDYSKLVPFLTGAVKTLAAQVEALQTRIAEMEAALGV